MVNPVVDAASAIDGDERRHRTDARHPRVPGVQKAGLTSWEFVECVRRGPSTRRRSRRPARRRWPASARPRSAAPTAMQGIHQPESMADTVAGARRLVFDELFRLQLIARRAQGGAAKDATGIAHPAEPADALTPRGAARATARRSWRGSSRPRLRADRRAAPRDRRALADLPAPLPMHRLLQGDVGAGKTVVALAALLAAVDGGRQGALMVPTEVLAEQHAYAVPRARSTGWSSPTRRRLGASRPVLGRAAHLAGQGRGAGPAHRGARARLGRPRRRHARAAHRRRALPLARRGRHRRAAPLRRRAARRAREQGRRGRATAASIPTCS